MREPEHPQYDHTDIPPTLSSPAAPAFWAAIVFTGLGAGIAAGLLTMPLESIEHFVWPGPNILDAAAQSAYPRHLLVLLGAGLVTGAGQFFLHRLTSANGIADLETRVAQYRQQIGVDRRRYRGEAPGATAARAKNRRTRCSGGCVSPIKEAGPTEGLGDFTPYPPTTHPCKTQGAPSETTMNNATHDAGFGTSSWITLRWTRGSRYYCVHLEQDLWLSWLLTQVNGRSGTPLGRARFKPAATIEAALLELAHISKRRRQRSYELMR